jgi:hypothetical protein
MVMKAACVSTLICDVILGGLAGAPSAWAKSEAEQVQDSAPIMPAAPSAVSVPTSPRALPPNDGLPLSDQLPPPALPQPPRDFSQGDARYGAESDPTQTAPGEARHRPFRLRLELGVGAFNPTDVENFVASQENGNSESILTGGTLPLANIEVSAAYYPRRYVGVRPHVAILVPLDQIGDAFTASGSGPTYSMSSCSLGLSLDLTLDRGRMARYFLSPGLAYHFASFSAVVPQYRTGSITETWNADGIGYEIAFGSEFSFGERRAKGISISLVLQRVKLPVSSKPGYLPSGAPPINTLDFSSILLQIGYQMALSSSGSGS